MYSIREMLGLLEVFYSPSKVFDQVRERGMWLPAFLAIVLMSLVTSYFIVNAIGMETLVRKQLESNPQQLERLGPEGVARAANSPFAKGMTYGAPLVATPIVLLVVAGLFTAGLSITGSKLRFAQVLGATSYAWWPYALLTALMSILIVNVAPNKEDLNIRNLIATNVGAFLDPVTTNKAVYAMASSIDVLSFALVAFLAYGLARVSGRKFGSCLGIVVALWLIYVIGKVGFAAAFSR